MVELSVCIGSSCHIKGSYNVMQTFQQMIEENLLHDKIDLKASFCTKQCQKEGIAVTLDGEIFHISPEAAKGFFKTEVLTKIK